MSKHKISFHGDQEDHPDFTVKIGSLRKANQLINYQPRIIINKRIENGLAKSNCDYTKELYWLASPMSQWIMYEGED